MIVQKPELKPIYPWQSLQAAAGHVACVSQSDEGKIIILHGEHIPSSSTEPEQGRVCHTVPADIC